MHKPPFVTFLVGALIAAAITVVVDNAWAAAYGASTGLRSTMVAPFAISVSSIAPILVGALVWFGLSRVTARAEAVMLALTAALMIASVVVGVAQKTLPDGTAKPDGFQGLVQPMHVVVPVVFCAVMAWWLRRSAPAAR